MKMAAGRVKTFVFVAALSVAAALRSHHHHQHSSQQQVVHFSMEAGTDHAAQVGFMPAKDDLDRKTFLRNCGPEGGYFNLSVEPKEMNPTSTIKVAGRLVIPMDLDSGWLKGMILYEGQPFLTLHQQYDCKQLLAALATVSPFKDLTRQLSCPLRKGQRYEGAYVVPNTESILGYDGDYTLKAHVTNKAGESICVAAKLTILPF